MSAGRTASSVALVGAMAATAFVTLDNAEPWAGDQVGPIWVACGFFVPFLIGIALGRAAMGIRANVLGALAGAITVVAPTLIYLASGERDYAGHELSTFFAAFIPLAMTQGAIAMPVGVAARSRPRSA